MQSSHFWCIAAPTSKTEDVYWCLAVSVKLQPALLGRNAGLAFARCGKQLRSAQACPCDEKHWHCDAEVRACALQEILVCFSEVLELMCKHECISGLSWLQMHADQDMT